MTIQHTQLAAGKWAKLSTCEKLANIGSEVGRAINWKKKDKKDLSQRAINRALELLDFSFDSVTSIAHLKEFTRLREVIVDYFYGVNQYCSSERVLRKYFDGFNYLIRKNY